MNFECCVYVVFELFFDFFVIVFIIFVYVMCFSGDFVVVSWFVFWGGA